MVLYHLIAGRNREINSHLPKTGFIATISKINIIRCQMGKKLPVICIITISNQMPMGKEETASYSIVQLNTGIHRVAKIGIPFQLLQNQFL